MEERRITELTIENMWLRKQLWLRHGCKSLYGDDGEMQCSACRIDFLRDPVALIRQKFSIVTAEALSKAIKEGIGIVSATGVPSEQPGGHR